MGVKKDFGRGVVQVSSGCITEERGVQKFCRENFSGEVWCEKTFVNERRSVGVGLRYEAEKGEYEWVKIKIAII